jgi:hypothetical protein
MTDAPKKVNLWSAVHLTLRGLLSGSKRRCGIV